MNTCFVSQDSLFYDVLCTFTAYVLFMISAPVLCICAVHVFVRVCCVCALCECIFHTVFLIQYFVCVCVMYACLLCVFCARVYTVW